MFVMAPTFSLINEGALQPWMNGQIAVGDAYTAAMGPLRDFMFAQVSEKDLGLMTRLAGDPQPANPDAVPTTTLIPAFIISELRTAFLIGFMIFIPFVLIDLVVSAVLTSVGMVMLPPTLVALPFKLLLFIIADGWYLIVESLVGSFNR
jgi:flagellar biosynthesis protein FliP